MNAAIENTGATGAAVDDCWKRIGVSGDRSCEKLIKHLHCRNCPVYVSAAMGFLDQAISPDYLSELTDYVSRGQVREEGGTHAVIIFRLGGEWFALPMLALEEVVERRAIHSLPHRRDGVVLGLVNVRGALLICVSLARLMGLNGTAQDEGDDKGRLLVVTCNDDRLAAPVDEVGGIVRYRPDELKTLPDTVTKGAASFTKAIFSWKGRTVGLLDNRRISPTLNRSVA